MTNRITQHRIGDRIAFLTDDNIEIATLYDHHNHIIFDRYADIRVPIGLAPDIDWAAEFKNIGLNVAKARLIDAMPSPDINI